MKLVPGIYEGIPFTEYCTWKAINQSSIPWGFRSILHLYHALAGRMQKDSRSMSFGHALHVYIFEYDKFEQKIGVGPCDDKRLKKWKKFEEAAEQDVLITSTDFNRLKIVRKNILDNKIARKLIEAEGSNEVSILWKNPETGLLCKGRTDKLISKKKKIIVDLKSTQDASYDAFSKSIWNYNYHIQSSFYKEGLKVLTGEDFEFIILAVENFYPFATCVYHMNDEESLEIGKLQYQEILNKYKIAIDNYKQAKTSDKFVSKSDFFDGYDENIMGIGIPQFAKKRF